MSEKITIEVYDLNQVSDGYHTIAELYDHRCLLFILLCIESPQLSRWKKDHFDGWDCLYFKTNEGQISYHIPEEYRELYENKIERDESFVYDGHTSSDVLDRLHRHLSFA